MDADGGETCVYLTIAPTGQRCDPFSRITQPRLKKGKASSLRAGWAAPWVGNWAKSDACGDMHLATGGNASVVGGNRPGGSGDGGDMQR